MHHGPFPSLLFRGLASTDWGLETTLERWCEAEKRPTPGFREYYSGLVRAKPAIETFTTRRWDERISILELDELLNPKSTGILSDRLMSRSYIYEYVAYLRHHGFPSPLLDWSASPYVAAFFAFDEPPKADAVCVYALLPGRNALGSSNGHLWVIGKYMNPHPRHLLQQCQYSMCTAYRPTKDDYEFIPQLDALDGLLGSGGALYQITIPGTERATALKQLETMNINEFSLFGSEDSLIRTVARRELLFWE